MKQLFIMMIGIVSLFSLPGCDETPKQKPVPIKEETAKQETQPVQTTDSDNTVRWAITIEPPITYMEGDQFIGYGIDMLKMLQKSLPEYKHKIYDASNYTRLTEEIKKGPLTAAIGLFKTEERKPIMWFAKVPFFYFYNIQIAMKKKNFETLGSPGKISITEFLKNKKYTLGISQGRTYFKELGQILEKTGKQENIYVVAQNTVAENLFQMMLQDRINYMFMYPEEAMFLSSKHSTRNDVVTVPVAEGEEFGFSWAVCTKNEQGKILIDKISKALQDIRQQDEYRSQYEKWISSNLFNNYRESYKNKFLKVYEE